MPEDFAEIVREHQGLVFRTLTRMLGRDEDVNDLAQEVFMRLHRALPQFGRRAQLSTYVYRIAVNVAQDEWKRRRRPDRRVESLSDPRTCTGGAPRSHAWCAEGWVEMDCDETRAALRASDDPVWPGDLAAHLAQCDACVGVAVDLALRQPFSAAPPPDFAADVARRARLENRPAGRSRSRGVIAGAVASAATLSAMTVWLATSGLATAGLPVAALLLLLAETAALALSTLPSDSVRPHFRP
jgi:RNA polymerase sigma factor (sigma-70 family)